ncbi:MAG: hypothetical protein ABW133_22950 [Polyangiaceae bacterium]
MFETIRRYPWVALILFGLGACTAHAQIGGTSSATPGTPGSPPPPPTPPPPPPPPPSTGTTTTPPATTSSPTPATTVATPSTPSKPSTPTTTPPSGGLNPGSVDSKPAGSCSTDSDCKAVSDTCDACNCRALSKDGSLAKCTGGKTVACVMDPCRGKHAVCTAGKCAVADGPTM